MSTEGTLIAEHASPEPERCRCGSRIPAGASAWRFARPPEEVSALLSGVRFCSVVCARASLLESLALFESSTAAAVVKDVGAVLSAFRQLYLGLSASAS